MQPISLEPAAPSPPLRPATRRGSARSFGTFGELLQGALPDPALEFLVTFPIELYSHATFTVGAEGDGLRVDPPQLGKSLELARRLLARFELPASGSLVVSSELPVGKGFASSSADQVATARAIAACFDLDLPDHVLEAVLREIEPTDGVMYPAVVAFYHREVALRETLGPPPRVSVLAVDEGGVVETLQYNGVAKVFRQAERVEYADLLDELTDGLRTRDLARLGRVTTRSAELNQRFNPKRSLAQICDIAGACGALGVVVAHSGTCLGLLLDRDAPTYHSVLGCAAERLAATGYPMRLFEAWQGDAPPTPKPRRRPAAVS